MKTLTAMHIVGIVLTMAGIMGLGIYSGKKVKSGSDFTTGGRNAGTMLVAGTIIGTLVGGSSTIGTAQLAYTWGLSAWWFTIGAGLGCLILGLVFVKPLRDSGCETIQEMITVEYGPLSGVVTSVLATVGIVLNIVAQVLSANALLSTMFGFGPVLCAVITVVLMTCYVVFGGVLGTGMLGIAKLLLIYIAVVVCGVAAVVLGGGFGAFADSLPEAQYFNLFARGVGVDLGAGLSLILGVLSTQTYVQAVISGRNNAAAKGGSLISAVMIPPIGLGGILIGMYMRMQFPSMDPGQAFPQFIINNMPPLFGGIILATLLVAVLGTGSGMALGFGTIVTNDIYKRFINKSPDGRQTLMVSRGAIVVSLVVSALFTVGNLGSAILTWGFLSMGLRAAVLMVPMCTALFFKGCIGRSFAIASSIAGLCGVLAGSALNLSFDPLFAGMAASVAFAVVGGVIGQRGQSGKVCGH